MHLPVLLCIHLVTLQLTTFPLMCNGALCHNPILTQPCSHALPALTGAWRVHSRFVAVARQECGLGNSNWLVGLPAHAWLVGLPAHAWSQNMNHVTCVCCLCAALNRSCVCVCVYVCVLGTAQTDGAMCAVLHECCPELPAGVAGCCSCSLAHAVVYATVACIHAPTR